MSYFPQQPPPPPYTPNAPATYIPQQQPQQYVPPAAPQPQGQYNPQSWNAPQTPAYTPSPYAPSYSKPQDPIAGPIQYFPPPPSNSNPQNARPVSYQPPSNAPPTPAYTPSPSAPSNQSMQVSTSQSTQYYPSPPLNAQPGYQQVPLGNTAQAAQYPYSGPPLNAPPTPISPSTFANSDLRWQDSIASRTGYLAPAPPQNQSSQPPQLVENNAQAAYYPPSSNAPPAPTPGPTPAASYTDCTQSTESGYFPQSQPPFSPPGTPAQTNNAQAAYTNDPPVYGQTVPPSTQPNVPQPYTVAPQPAQNTYPHPQEKQQYVVPGQPMENIYVQEKQQYVIPGQSTQNVFPQHQYQQSPPQFAPPQTQQYPPISQVQQPFVPAGVAALPAKDDLKSSKTKRFLGDTLVGRAARSSVATVTSTVKLPTYLSPWGDNNPVTLPNVRYRDAALFATFHVIGGPLVDGAANVIGDVFGADTFVAEIASSGAGFVTGNLVVKYGVFQIVEQAIDKGVLEHMLPEVEKTMRTTTVKSMQVSIKHKLMGVDADIRFVGEYPTTNSTGCDKGWFCPYLFASSRAPIIPRSRDWAIAQCFNPYLAADTALARKLLAELPSVIPLCDPNPLARLPYARLLVLFTGITPFRANMWSSSRRPGCGQLFFHLLNGCVALVMPATTAKTPVLAWSPWTLNQMQNAGTSGYAPGTQHKQITDWLADIVERPGLYPFMRDVGGTFERIMSRVVTMIINGALAAPRAVDGKVFAKMDVERAGIVMFRY